MRKKYYEAKLFISKRSTNFVMAIFFTEVISFDYN